MDDEDETARVTLAQRVYLEQADAFVPGWQQAVLLELERMRRELPYADYLDLYLVAERRGS